MDTGRIYGSVGLGARVITPEAFIAAKAGRRSSIRLVAVILGVSVFCLGSAVAALAGGGELDPTFGGDGKVTTDFTARLDAARGIALQSDGRLVAAGIASGGYPRFALARFALARFNADGSLDTTFGGDGKVTTDFELGPAKAFDVAIQIDGKIVAAGVGGGTALARYNTDGTLDTTFGDGGKVTINFPGGNQANALVIQADGQIVTVSVSRLGTDPRFALARFNADGSLDTTFGGDGKVTINFPGGNQANALVIQADGQIVTVGVSRLGTDPRFTLARFNADGSLDTTFGGDGKVTTDFELGPAKAFDVAIQIDGKIVAAGVGGGTALARYNTDGTLDTTFGDGGKVTINFPGGNQANALVIQADGQIVTVGVSRLGTDPRFTLARFLSS